MENIYPLEIIIILCEKHSHKLSWDSTKDSAESLSGKSLGFLVHEKKENKKEKGKNRTVLGFATTNVACFEILVHPWLFNLRKSCAWAWVLILSMDDRHKPK